MYRFKPNVLTLFLLRRFFASFFLVMLTVCGVIFTVNFVERLSANPDTISTLIDTWICNYGNIDARQVTGGSWTAWTLANDKMDNKGNYAKADLTFMVLSDGSVSLKGTIKFSCLTEYSYIKSLLELDEKTYTLNETITSTSGMINLDDNTTLKYSKDSLTLKFSKTDQITAYTKEVCSAEYRFEH